MIDHESIEVVRRRMLLESIEEYRLCPKHNFWNAWILLRADMRRLIDALGGLAGEW